MQVVTWNVLSSVKKSRKVVSGILQEVLVLIEIVELMEHVVLVAIYGIFWVYITVTPAGCR